MRSPGIRTSLVPVAILAGLVAVSVAHGAPAAKAEACSLPARNVLHDVVLDLRDRARAEAVLDLPANVPVLLVAQEARGGIDGILELRDVSGAVAAADNPVRRRGPQRMLLEPRPARRVTIAGIGTEVGKGRLTVSMMSLAGASPQCVAILRALSSSDALYAHAQAVSLGVADAGGVNLSELYARAAQGYRDAGVLATQPGSLRAHILLSDAGARYSAADYPAARDAAEIAATAYRALGDDYLADRARSLHAMSLLEIPGSAERFELARAELREVAAASVRRAEVYEQAMAVNNVGISYQNAAEFAKSIPEFRVAQTLQHGLGERMREAQALQNIALSQTGLSLYAQARESYEETLALLDVSTSPKLYADILNNRALLDWRTGRYDDALRGYSDALATLERLHSDIEQARSLHGIASVYNTIGHRREALAYYQRAFDKRSKTADFRGYLTSVVTYADRLSESGALDKAISIRTEALANQAKSPLVSRIQVGLARDQVRAGALDEARRLLGEVIGNQASGDRVVVARAQLVRARLALAEGKHAAASADVAAARDTFSKYQLPKDEFDALYLGAEIACAQRDIVGTQRSLEASLSLAETVRRSTNNPTLRASLWRPMRPAFDLSIRLALTPGICGGPENAGVNDRARRALAVAERSRARALGDFRELGAHRGTSAADIELENRRNQLFDEIAFRRQQLETQADLERPDSPVGERLRADLVRLMRELDILDANSPKVGVEQDAAPEKLRRAIEMIPADVAVVEYWLGELRSYAWVVTRSRVRLFDLGPGKNLNEAARRLNESMSRFMGTSFETRIANARALHALILAPLAAELQGARTLYVVPDGSLHQVAFATLVSSVPEAAAVRFVVDDHDIGVIPSIASYANEGAPVALDGRASLLIVSDPVYGRDDARFGERASRNLPPKESGKALLWTLRGGNVESLERLPGSEREAAAIAGLFDATRTQRLSGFEANRETLLSRDLSSFSIVHFATHSVADLEAPQLSALVLSTFDTAGKAIPGEVFAGDLLGRRLEADLVVLSGCDSSLGEEYAGEGLLGLRYAAHAAGARSVVASLWPVADSAGPRLMREFYSRATRGNVSAVAALSQAMRAARAQWRDPALWGVFQVSHAARARTLH